MRGLVAMSSVAVTALVVGLALGQFIEGGGATAVTPPVPAPATSVDQGELPVPGLAAEEAATIALFKGARESVVAITTATDAVNPFTLQRMRERAGSGSGFLWDDRGHVVTNDHVISGASRALVQLADGRSLEAALVGRDPVHDLAVLRITDSDLPAPLPLGDSVGLQVGQRVLAIGNPFGLDWTLTTGIVSALDRDLPGTPGGRAIGGLIQTDAAINPGNSGGPLLDSAGRLIGVNTAIYSPSGASAGIGFAVPVGTVARVVPQLVATGRYAPPSLGIVFDVRINAAVNRQGLDGVLVLDVMPGTDAARAGLEPARLRTDGRIAPGDVVTAVDGVPVPTVDALRAALDPRVAGDSVTVTVTNGGAAREIALVLVPTP
jgi:S1-C subfamily serine protease